MGATLKYIRISLERILAEAAIEEAYFGTQRIKNLFIREGITLPQDRLDELIRHYRFEIENEKYKRLDL